MWDDDAWPPPWHLVPWQSADVAPDDRTITVRFAVEYDADQATPSIHGAALTSISQPNDAFSLHFGASHALKCNET